MKSGMTEAIADTSPLQYLHQIACLDLLPKLIGHILVPPAVVSEIQRGKALGVELPDIKRLDWISIRVPAGEAVLPLVTDLGAGETEVLALALEQHGTPVLLDDGLARRTAKRLSIPMIGTLGVLLTAKRKRYVTEIKPLLGRLASLGFRMSRQTEADVLDLARE